MNELLPTGTFTLSLVEFERAARRPVEQGRGESYRGRR
jgi:hypothetical protein